MNLLAIETATDLVGASFLADPARPGHPAAAVQSEPGGRRHAEALAPAIEAVCARTGHTVRDVDVVAVDNGPGLFTGLRVGVATAKAFGQALGIGVVPVSSLDVLAAAALGRWEGTRPVTVVAVVDARRGEVFTATYRDGGAGDADPADLVVAPTDRCDPTTLVAGVERLVADVAGGPVVVVGDGAARYRDLLDGIAGVVLDLLDGERALVAPPPTVLAELARARLARGEQPAPAATVVPDYRREADARINWVERRPPER